MLYYNTLRCCSNLSYYLHEKSFSIYATTFSFPFLLTTHFSYLKLLLLFNVLCVCMLLMQLNLWTFPHYWGVRERERAGKYNNNTLSIRLCIIFMVKRKPWKLLIRPFKLLFVLHHFPIQTIKFSHLLNRVLLYYTALIAIHLLV